MRDTGAEAGLVESRADGTHRGLRGETGQVCQSARLTDSYAGLLTINGNVDDVGAGLSSGQHGRDGDTGRVVRVDVDRQVRVGLSDRANQPVIVSGTIRAL